MTWNWRFWRKEAERLLHRREEPSVKSIIAQHFASNPAPRRSTDESVRVQFLREVPRYPRLDDPRQTSMPVDLRVLWQPWPYSSPYEVWEAEVIDFDEVGDFVKIRLMGNVSSRARRFMFENEKDGKWVPLDQVHPLRMPGR